MIVVVVESLEGRRWFCGDGICVLGSLSGARVGAKPYLLDVFTFQRGCASPTSMSFSLDGLTAVSSGD